MNVKTSNDLVIRDNVIDYSFDSNYIIAVQKPPESVPQQKNYAYWKIAYEKSNFKQYWIINKRQEPVFNSKTLSFSNVCGPLTKEDFFKKLKQLNISWLGASF